MASTEDPLSRNIVLTGFMGTGKTTVGRLLATRLDFDFVDTDVMIEQRHGPIPTIFRDYGESRFREIEREIAAELGSRAGLVIATGGRLMLDPANVTALSRNGRVFCLVATPDEILERVVADTSPIERPLLAVPDPRKRVVELLAERTPEYRRFAQLPTDSVSPQSVADNIATLATTDPHQFAVDSPTGDYSYMVGAAILPFVRQLASIDGPMVVITDPKTKQLYLPSLPSPDLVIEVGARLRDRQRDKSLDAVREVYDQLLDAGIDRSATIVSLGDSVVGDIAAFVAATYLRGLDLVHCPTDLIAMVDTSVGGKVGLDLDQGRNLIGLFKQPKAVVADVATLQTLDARSFAAGMAEVLKHALIADSTLLSEIEDGDWRNEDYAFSTRLGDLQNLVTQAVQVKIAVVQEDPFDEDLRQTLNLGHTFAHSFEQVDADDLIHGEAVGLGLIAAARLSAELGHCSRPLSAQVEALVEQLGLPTTFGRSFDLGAVVSAIDRDKKRLGGVRRFVLLSDVGKAFVSEQVGEDALLKVLRSLQP